MKKSKVKSQKSKVLGGITYHVSRITSRSGFTLIELLIVIALLGALAVGLIGALDPFEQLKKGTDTGTRDLVNQIQTAVIRFYSVKNHMPWCDDAGVCTEPAASGTNLKTAPIEDAITRMQDAGELKTDFTTIQAGKLDKVFVYGDSATNRVEACYSPDSKSFRADPNTKFNPVDGTVMGTEGDTCRGHSGPQGPGASVCYWCIQ